MRDKLNNPVSNPTFSLQINSIKRRKRERRRRAGKWPI